MLKPRNKIEHLKREEVVYKEKVLVIMLFCVGWIYHKQTFQRHNYDETSTITNKNKTVKNYKNKKTNKQKTATAFRKKVQPEG